mgnify:CR=1 FL=1
MPEFETSIDVDIDEFLDECSDREKKEIIECLIEDEYLPETVLDENTPEDTYWNQQVKKLIGNDWKMSNEDIEKILSITQNII